MTKQDLQPGMIVETRNGELYMVQNFHGELILVNNSGWNALKDYNNDLTCIRGSFELRMYDIMKVMIPIKEHHFCEKNWKKSDVLWERKEIELNEEEKTLIRLLDKKWKWMVRDKDGDIVVHDSKPIKKEEYYCWWKQGNGDYFYFNGFDESAKFNFLKWEDDEPTNIDDLRELVEEE